MNTLRLTAMALTLTGFAAPAAALDFELGPTKIALNSKLSSGVTWRLQDRDGDLIGKLNIPGQSGLCQADNCISFSGGTEPNARLVAAQGAFSGVNADDGDINYDRYDIVAATTKLNSDLRVEYGDFLFRAHALGFYDPVNADFNERHFDTRYQPAKTERPGSVKKEFARGVKLLDLYGSYAFNIGENAAVLTVGQQTVRWGEALLVALNSVSEINPPNASVLRMPGAEISEFFQPVPVISLSGDVVEGVSAELIYQFGWKKVIPDQRGAFFSDSDLIGGNKAVVSLGQFGEDPDQQATVGGSLATISSTSTTISLNPEQKPSHGGQYGLRVNYNAEWLNGGTETSFYFLNYHSRLPYATVIATEESCARDATSLTDAIGTCGTFNGTLSRTLPAIPGVANAEPLPIDTLQAFLSYPENIQMYGLSFTTNVGKFAIAGEASYRPNVPLQVHLTDVIFAGLQPAFPTMPISAPPGGPTLGQIADAVGLGPSAIPVPLVAGLAELGTANLPSAEQGIPSYLLKYRGINRVEPRQVIEGFERQQVVQVDLTALRAFSTNPFGADQIISITEVGFTWVPDLPDRNELQFEGGGVHRTHFSGGSDGTGFSAANSCDGSAVKMDGTGQTGSNYTCHLNPTQQTRGYANGFAWGIREIIRSEYNDVIFGWSFKPQIILQWDVNGTAPFPLQNFIKNRMQADVGTDINITQALSARANYQVFWGGGKGENTRTDRDNISLALLYSF